VAESPKSQRYRRALASCAKILHRFSSAEDSVFASLYVRGDKSPVRENVIGFPDEHR